jgi:hypothetical protein
MKVQCFPADKTLNEELLKYFRGASQPEKLQVVKLLNMIRFRLDASYPQPATSEKKARSPRPIA